MTVQPPSADMPRTSARDQIAQGVVAVVVTHNRMAMLPTCIEAIRTQVPRPEHILVIDSESSDGTPEWLSMQDDLLVIRQTNCGGAGAFHTAIETAMDLGAQWIWTTDDDGFAQSGALIELLEQANQHDLDLVGPLVVDADDPSELAFPLHGRRTIADLMVLADNGVVMRAIALFNGTLIRRSTVERIGNIKREMFIWGDEYEYTLRAREAGLKFATAVNAVHLHPGLTRRTVPILGGCLGTVEELPPHRAPYFFRNMGYIHATYEKTMVVPRMIGKYLLYYLLKQDIRGLGVFLANYVAGLRDDYPEELRRPAARLPLPE